MTILSLMITTRMRGHVNVMLGGFMEWNMSMDFAGVHPIYFAKCLTRMRSAEVDEDMESNGYYHEQNGGFRSGLLAMVKTCDPTVATVTKSAVQERSAADDEDMDPTERSAVDGEDMDPTAYGCLKPIILDRLLVENEVQ
ncbi:hypothetical protein Tco_0958702, partial [Tanacetum coccineum]